MNPYKPNLRLIELVSELNQLRDACMELGLILREYQFENNPNKRNEVNGLVEQQLTRLNQEAKMNFEQAFKPISTVKGVEKLLPKN